MTITDDQGNQIANCLRQLQDERAKVHAKQIAIKDQGKKLMENERDIDDLIKDNERLKREDLNMGDEESKTQVIQLQVQNTELLKKQDIWS